MEARCPTCKADALPRAQNPVAPFCSIRCREVDLGKWLGEEFRLVDSEDDPPRLNPANSDVEDEER